MSVYNLPIKGIIGNKPEEDKSADVYFSYTDLLLHLNSAKEYPIINLIIDSPGGYIDDAEKMKSAILATGKIIMSENSGDVMSAGLTLFLIASKQNRKFNPAKGNMLPHFPWGGVEGEADEITDYAKGLKKIEENYVSVYSEATGTDENIMRELMAQDTILKPEQIEAFGFATLVTSVIATARAFFNHNNNQNEMDAKQLEEKMSGLEKIMMSLDAGIKKFFKNAKVQMIVLSDVEGNELDFGEIKDVSEIVPGVPVKVNGSPAENKSYVMPDGTTIVCEAGLVKEVILPEPNELEMLKKENADLKTQLEAKQGEVTQLSANFETYKKESEGQMLSIKTEIETFKSQFTELKPLMSVPTSGQSNNNKKEIKFIKPS